MIAGLRAGVLVTVVGLGVSTAHATEPAHATASHATTVTPAAKPKTTPAVTPATTSSATTASATTAKPAVTKTVTTAPVAKTATPASATPTAVNPTAKPAATTATAAKPAVTPTTTAAKPAVPTTTRAAATTPSVTPVRPVRTPAPEMAVEERVTYSYNALGRRDPFQPLVGGGYVGADEQLAPPDIGGIKVVGIVWGAQDKFALVEDPRGNSMVLRQGDKVMNGTVDGLRRDKLIIKLATDGVTEYVEIPLTRKGDSNANR